MKNRNGIEHIDYTVAIEVTNNGLDFAGNHHFGRNLKGYNSIKYVDGTIIVQVTTQSSNIKGANEFVPVACFIPHRQLNGMTSLRQTLGGESEADVILSYHSDGGAISSYRACKDGQIEGPWMKHPL